MGYTAGNLNVEINGLNSNALNSIQEVINKLKPLQSTINSISSLSFKGIGKNVTKPLTEFVNSLQGLNVNIPTTINQLPSAVSALKSLSELNGIKLNGFNKSFDAFGKSLRNFGKIDVQKISTDLVTFITSTKGVLSVNSAGSFRGFTNFVNSIRKVEKLDFLKLRQGFNDLTTAIRPFLAEIQKSEGSLTALEKVLKTAGGKNFGKIINPKSNKGGGFFSFSNVAKWGTSIYMARRLGRVMGDIVQSGADYTETLNLWETAMRNNIDTATDFVKKMNEAYGISEKTLMNAQATFKNMLGALGQISEETAYALSEGVTQMAVDYASLYNVQFEKAFEKFQSALAGQVRPVRSVSGYDITENTLYQLYQSIGGQKSVRNLSRTEKQLLSILAIFNQMSASGAIGDLDKTMESFANQSRVMSENWNRIKQYTGTVLANILHQSGVMKYINGLLIFLGDTMKAVAESENAIMHFGDPFESTTEGAIEAGKAIDEVQGKLLDFDKFRSLSSAEDNAIGIDERLLTALSGYDTILSNANMEATEIAKTLKEITGLFDEDGIFNEEKWKNLSTYITVFGAVLGSVFTASLAVKITKFLASPLSLVIGAITLLISGIVALSNAWGDMGWGQRILTILSAVTAGVIGLVIALKALKMNPISAIAVGATLAGGVLLVGSQLSKQSVNKFADGGMPDKGTMFIAGEAGAEMVYNTPSGQSGVANIQQIEQAMYGALVRYGKTQSSNGQPIEVYLDGEKVYQNTTAHAKRRGNVWGKA